MKKINTPFRYPGGKSQLYEFVKHNIRINISRNPINYVEPFAGGAGVAIELLLHDDVKNIFLNDLDIGIYSAWKAMIEETDKFVEEIKTTEVSLKNFYNKKEIYNNKKDKYSFELGFATFFLNRTAYSGIITGGPLGGRNQNKFSQYKIDCRFNKEDLIKKIRKIGERRKNIKIFNLDASDFINKKILKLEKRNTFIFFDPPYYKQGESLYKKSFRSDLHESFAMSLSAIKDYFWIITYDKHPKILEIYSKFGYPIYDFDLKYFANKKRKEIEYMISSSEVQLNFPTVGLIKATEFDYLGYEQLTMF